jgi:hypothetical protein
MHNVYLVSLDSTDVRFISIEKKRKNTELESISKMKNKLLKKIQSISIY